MSKTLGIGLAGFGTVGTGVWETLERNGELITSRSEVRAAVKRIAVRDISKPRLKSVPTDLFTPDWEQVVADDTVDIVIELIGGTTTAFDIVAAALQAKKPVVTGNKALLAERGRELFALSREMNTPIYFEAAVAGGIPIIKAVQDSYVGNRIQSMVGVINGTSNYILERMTDAGYGYEEALAEAQQLGYAEADPTLDVNGWDAAHKAILLATLAYGFIIDADKIYVRGIERVRAIDINFAKQLGFVVKLLCVVHEHPDGTIELRTQPSFIPQSHVLSSVNGVFNAVAVRGDTAGESLFYGRGAGKDPTASSVVADIVAACHNKTYDNSHQGFLPYKDTGNIMDIEDTETPYYVRFDVNDEPGVIAKIATALADAGIGVAGTHSPVNAEEPDADFVDMVFQLHTCKFGLLKKTLKNLESLSCVNSRPVVFRIENLG
ncbi:MAG TPA: homoserine dehydrogenase [Verrucomicrobiales bacterium]|nr:homoserine dehydrogenase [Verrucomicrobiales bacterium]